MMRFYFMSEPKNLENLANLGPTDSPGVFTLPQSLLLLIILTLTLFHFVKRLSLQYIPKYKPYPNAPPFITEESLRYKLQNHVFLFYSVIRFWLIPTVACPMLAMETINWLPSSRMANIWNLTKLNANKDAQQQKFSLLRGGNPKWYSHFGRRFASFFVSLQNPYTETQPFPQYDTIRRCELWEVIGSRWGHVVGSSRWD